MEVSASSPGKNEELTLALRTWSKLEEETTGRLRNSTGGSGTGLVNGNGKDRGDGVGIAERQREGPGLGLGPNGKRVGGAVPMGSTAVEVDNEDDDNDGKNCYPCVPLTQQCDSPSVTPIPVALPSPSL